MLFTSQTQLDPKDSKHTTCTLYMNLDLYEKLHGYNLKLIVYECIVHKYIHVQYTHYVSAKMNF